MSVTTEESAGAAAIRPFTVEIPEAEIEALRARVAATRWPHKELVDDWSQGVQLAMLQELARYWAADYDWRRCEAALNALPQFTTEIDGLGGFDAALIDEANTIATKLRERPAVPVMEPEKVRAARVLRNRVVTLLRDKMILVRSAAKFVFRKSPEIARESTSVYERRRRAAARRAKKQESKAGGTDPKGGADPKSGTA